MDRRLSIVRREEMGKTLWRRRLPESQVIEISILTDV